MKEIAPAQRRFLFLLSVLAALLAGCLLVFMKALVEHPALRNAIGAVALVVLGPFLWILIEAIFGAALDTGLGKIELHFPKWVHTFTIMTLFIGSIALLADEVFDLGWISW